MKSRTIAILVLANEHLELTHFRALRIDPPSACRMSGERDWGCRGKGRGGVLEVMVERSCWIFSSARADPPIER